MFKTLSFSYKSLRNKHVYAHIEREEEFRFLKRSQQPVSHAETLSSQKILTTQIHYTVWRGWAHNRRQATRSRIKRK